MNESLESKNNSNLEIDEARLEKIPDHFDAVIVLGKNWREYPKTNTRPDDLKLSIESKMSAIAGAEMIRAGLADKIILSTGKTAGQEFPSEAEAMRDYIVKKYENISTKDILIETQSKDTHGNAEEVLKIIQEHNLKTLALLTVGFHLERAEQIFNNHNIDTFPFPSEDFLLQRSSHYQKFVTDFQKSSHIQVEQIKEWILRHFLILDPKGKIISEIAKTIRK